MLNNIAEEQQEQTSPEVSTDSPSNLSFKYPFVFLGDSIAMVNHIKKQLTKLQSWSIGEWTAYDGEQCDIVVELYGEFDGQDTYADMYYVFLEYGNYMFTFHILDAAFDCIQELKSKDVNAIYRAVTDSRYELNEQTGVML